MKEITISRTYELQCAHFLPDVPEGHKCKRLHGHTWSITVSYTGIPDGRGWFADFAELDEVFQVRVMDVLDHRLLNDVVRNATTENLCYWIAEQLGDTTLGVSFLSAVEACENSRSSVRLAVGR